VAPHLDPSLRLVLDELESVRASDPAELRQIAVEAMRRATESEVAMFYAPTDVGEDTLRAVDWAVAGTGARAAAVRHEFERGFRIDKSTAHGPRAWSRRFVKFDELVRRWPAAMQAHTAETAGPVGVIDQLLLQTESRGQHLGWLGGLRFAGERAYPRELTAALRPLVGPVGGYLVQAHAIAGAARPEEACDLLVDALGRVDYATPTAKAWLALDAVVNELRRVIRAVDRRELPAGEVPFRGATARVVRMERDHRVRYLVHLDAPPPMPEKVRLTRAEHEIAELAAAGATIAEIAAHRQTSHGTVRNQLKRVYQRLGVNSRVELARVLRGR
jgi:DNA-binding CsgD family transcriptional regulator